MAASVAWLVAVMLVVAVPPADAARVRTVTYSGDGAYVYRHSGQLSRLADTSAPFRRFVQLRLDQMWREAGSRDRCAHAPLVIVKRFRSDGYAKGAEGVYGACPSGGAAVISAAIPGGIWQPVLGTQEGLYRCQGLKLWRVPEAIGGRQCYAGSRTVPYRRPATAPTVHAGYAARLAAQYARPSTRPTAELFATPSVVTQLLAMRADGADGMTSRSCFGPTDPTFGRYLDGAPRGCILDAFYGDYRALYVERLQPESGHWKIRSLVAYASS